MIVLIYLLSLNFSFSKVEGKTQSLIFEIGHHSSEAFELKAENETYSLLRFT